MIVSHAGTSLKHLQQVGQTEYGRAYHRCHYAEILVIKTFIHGEVTDEFAGLPVHGKGILLTVIRRIQKPYGI